MRKFYKLIAAITLAYGFAPTASAQKAEKDYEPYPHMFVGVQGGVQNTFNNSFNNWKTFTPTASLSFGGYFNKIVGSRLHFNGIWDKGSAEYLNGQTPSAKFDYKYLTTSADVLVNLCTLFGNKDSYPVNLIYIMGLGANYAWDNSDAMAVASGTPAVRGMEYAANDKRWAFNARVGLGLDIPVHKNVSVNLEADLNHIIPGDNHKFVTDNLQFTGQVGVNFKFGYKKKAVEEEWVTRIDTIWYDDVAYTPRVEDGTITWNVFYEIRESDFNDPDAQLRAIGAFLAEHRECKVSIKSYADVQTGNPKINMGYSQQRSEKAVKALVGAGVDPSIIKAEYFGDTVQPFAENDKNRVSIITATGLKDVKDKYTVKKYRTKEVRELKKK